MISEVPFSDTINIFSLRFKDEKKEEKYRKTKITMTNSYTILRWVINAYVFLILVCLVVSSIKAYKGGNNQNALTFVLLFVAVILVLTIEYIFCLFQKTLIVHGVLSMQLTMIIMAVYFENVSLGEAKPPGDYGVFVIQLLIGLYMCDNWIMTCISAFLSNIIYVILHSLYAGSFSCNKCFLLNLGAEYYNIMSLISCWTLLSAVSYFTEFETKKRIYENSLLDKVINI